MIPILVVRYKCPEMEDRCLQLVRRHTKDTPHRIITYDNDPKNEPLSIVWNRMIEADPAYVQDAEDRQVMEAWATPEANPDPIFCLLNTDCFVREGWLGRLARVMTAKPAFGFVGPMTDNCGSVQSKGHPKWTSPVPGETDMLQAELGEPKGGFQGQVLTGRNHISGFCMLIRREAWLQAGRFDEDCPFYGEESALIENGWRAGWETAIALDTFVEHLGGATFQAAESAGETTWDQRKQEGRAWFRSHMDTLRQQDQDPFK